MGAGRGMMMSLRRASTMKSGGSHQTEKNKKAKEIPIHSRKRRMREEPQKCEKRRRTLAPNLEECSPVGGTKGQLENQFNKLVCQFGDCDPDYIALLLVQQKEGPKGYKCVRKELLTNYKTYPKLREKLRKQYVREQREKLGNSLTLTEYIKRSSLIKLTGDAREDKNYLNDTVTYLGNSFKSLRYPYIRKIIGTDGLHPDSYQQLKVAEEAASQGLLTRPAQRFMFSACRRMTQYSEKEFSELFYLDKFYLENQAAIDDYRQQQEVTRTDENVSETEAFGISETECLVCLLLEPTDQMVSCQDGEHLFCKTCTGSYLKEQQTLGKEAFTCPGTDCKELLPLSILQEYLHESSYRQAELKIRERELLRAQVKGLEWCTQCPYGVVFSPDNKQTILQCENLDCLVATCRLCRDPAHIPYSCEERAEASKVMKQFIENEMSEAVIRKCPKCETRFVKDGGCNQMTCSKCRMKICYSCGNELKKCSKSKWCSITNATTLHRQNIEKIIPAAEKVFKKAHPEAEQLSFAAQFLKI